MVTTVSRRAWVVPAGRRVRPARRVAVVPVASVVTVVTVERSVGRSWRAAATERTEPSAGVSRRANRPIDPRVPRH